ncbi:glycosyl transferase family 2 [Paenibacillus sp. PCH8]|uniref:glycosyltransferase n=1 Tax=Paenibacillus sp. PCH8 TaxID=2066524 RepID=UPI000CF98497|nr:glycosyltransferase [Paenibacillus sp. PCH8]PQP84379.1 glycosyl transferase family 2 [Paenibacillus sp. PCH8]
MLDPKKRRQQVNGPMVHRDIRTETQRPQDIGSDVHDEADSSGEKESKTAAIQEETSIFREPFSIRRVRKSQDNKLTAMLQVRNERGRYLEEVLHDLSEFVDEIVIVDDASTDGTPEICKAFPKVVRLEVLEKPLFAEEWRLRNTLWQAAAGTRPDWLLSVDADELYSTEAKKAIRALINQEYADWFAFRFYDMWDGRTHYREDDLWCLHKRHTASLVRYMPGYPYFYPQQNHHVPRLPLSCTVLPGVSTELKVQHLGWAGSLEDRVRKYLRYKRIDPSGEWGSLAHYESILDPEPRLVPWKEGQ